MTGHANITYALITGSNRGIGLATAEELSKRGIFIFLASRSLQNAQEALAPIIEAGGKGKAVSLDVTSIESIQGAVDAVKIEVGWLDNLVNNAGIAQLVDNTSLTAVLQAYTSILAT